VTNIIHTISIYSPNKSQQSKMGLSLSCKRHQVSPQITKNQAPCKRGGGGEEVAAAAATTGATVTVTAPPKQAWTNNGNKTSLGDEASSSGGGGGGGSGSYTNPDTMSVAAAETTDSQSQCHVIDQYDTGAAAATTAVATSKKVSRRMTFGLESLNQMPPRMMKPVVYTVTIDLISARNLVQMDFVSIRLLLKAMLSLVVTFVWMS
jgi:hypothetical protein